MAAFQAKVGTFNAPGSGGSTITLGFRPRAVLLWSANATAENTWSNHLDLGLGFWAKTPSGNRAQSQWIRSDNGSNTAHAYASLNPTRPLSQKGWSIKSLTDTATGFTVAYQSDPPSGTRIHYLAIGGDEVIAQVATWQFTDSEVVGSTIPIRGIGFRPSAVIAISSITGDISLGTASPDKSLGFGVADAMRQQWSWSGQSLDNVNPSNTDRSWDETALISAVNDASGTAFRASLAAYAADGFDLNILAKPAANAEGTVYFLALSGLLSHATSFAKSTAAAPTTQTITTPFRPGVALLGSTHQTAEGATTSNRGTMGAGDGASQTGGAWSDTTGISPSKTEGIARTDAALIKADNSTRTQAAVAAVSALGASSATLSWSVNDAVASKVGLFALGRLTHALNGIASGGSATSAPPLEAPIPISATVEAGSRLFGTIAPIAQFAAVATGGSSAAAVLRPGAGFKGTIAAGSSAFASWSFPQPLVGVVAAGSTVSGVAGRARAFTGEVAAGSVVPPPRMRLLARFGGALTGGSVLNGYLRLALPSVRPAAANELAGTVNWHPNPSAEDGTNSFAPEGGTSIAPTTADAWEGASAITVSTSGAVSGQGVRALSVGGIGLTGIPRTIWSQIRVKGVAGQQVNVWTRLIYRGGLVVNGDPITITLTGKWDAAYAPAVVAEPSASLDQAECVVATATPLATNFLVDGVQIEEDHGAGATPWAIGSYTGDGGTWAGTPHRSVTIRQPLPVEIRGVGRGGVVTIEATMYRATFDNQWLEDISDYVISAEVECDPARDETWTLDATLTLDGWRKLTPYQDWVAPYMKVTYPDGTVREGQLGLYMVWDSPEQRTEYGGLVKLEAHDPLHLLGRQGFTGPFVVSPGVDRIHAVRAILDSAILTDADNGKRRYVIPDSGKEFKRRSEWPRKTTKLDLCNEILKGTGFQPLWTTATGVITSRKRGEARLRHRQPVRTWVANLPIGYTLDPSVPRVSNLKSEVVGAIATQPKAYDLDNEIVLVNDDPESGRIRVTHHIVNKKNPRAVFSGRGRTKTRQIPWPLLDDEATAKEIAAALADELSTLNTTVAFGVLPDPSVSLIHETVSLAIWDAFGDPIAVGKYAVHTVRYGFTPGSALMQLDLGAVGNADELVEAEAAAA